MKLLLLSLALALLFSTGKSVTDSPLSKQRRITCALRCLASDRAVSSPHLAHFELNVNACIDRLLISCLRSIQIMSREIRPWQAAGQTTFHTCFDIHRTVQGSYTLNWGNWVNWFNVLMGCLQPPKMSVVIKCTYTYTHIHMGQVGAFKHKSHMINIRIMTGQDVWWSWFYPYLSLPLCVCMSLSLCVFR